MKGTSGDAESEQQIDLSTMVNHEIDFDESRGGPRHPFNYISSPPNGELRKATQKIFKWEPSGAHDPGRVKLPSVHIEAMFRRAPPIRQRSVVTFMWKSA